MICSWMVEFSSEAAQADRPVTGLGPVTRRLQLGSSWPSMAYRGLSMAYPGLSMAYPGLGMAYCDPNIRIEQQLAHVK